MASKVDEAALLGACELQGPEQTACRGTAPGTAEVSSQGCHHNSWQARRAAEEVEERADSSQGRNGGAVVGRQAGELYTNISHTPQTSCAALTAVLTQLLPPSNQALSDVYHHVH